MTTPTRRELAPVKPSHRAGDQTSGLPPPEEDALPGEAAPDRRAARTP